MTSDTGFEEVSVDFISNSNDWDEILNASTTQSLKLSVDTIIERRQPKLPLASSLNGSYFGNSFDRPYFDDYSSSKESIEPVGQLVKYINFVRGQPIGLPIGEESGYYARYFTICQSSGYGKSRSIKEIANQVFIIPICLRPPSVQNTQPPKTPHIADYMQSLSKDGWLALLNAIAVTIWRWKDSERFTSPADWYSKMTALSVEVVGFWKEVTSLDPHYCSRFIENLPECDFMSQFAMVVDEAGFLLHRSDPLVDPPFVYFCRALSMLTSKIPFVTIFIDTNLSVSNFAPQNVYHSSSRVQSGQKLFPPFLFYPLDVFCAIQRAGNISEDLIMYREKYAIRLNNDRQVQVSFNPLLAALYSRAMFSTWVVNEAAGIRTDVDRPSFFAELEDIVYKLAYSKLITGGDRGANVAFVCASCRFSLSTTSNKTQQELVRHHMATLLAVDNKRENLLVEYPVEPLLSLVAANYMRQSDEHWIKVLLAIKDEIRTGSLECNGMKGELGELVACLLLTRCFDLLSVELSLQASDNDSQKRQKTGSTSSSAFTQPPLKSRSAKMVPVADLISLLVGDECKAKLESTKDEARFGLVGFTRFARVERPMTAVFLRALLVRGVAAVAKKGEAAIDLYIPMVIPIVDALVDLSDPNTYILSCVIIQVKNDVKVRSSYPLWEAMKQSDLAVELTDARIPLIFGIMHMGDRARSHDDDKILSLPPPRANSIGSERGVDRLGKSCFMFFFSENNGSFLSEDMNSILISFLSCSNTRRLMSASRLELLGVEQQAINDAIMIDDNIESCFRPLVLGTNIV